MPGLPGLLLSYLSVKISPSFYSLDESFRQRSEGPSTLGWSHLSAATAKSVFHFGWRSLRRPKTGCYTHSEW